MGPCLWVSRGTQLGPEKGRHGPQSPGLMVPRPQEPASGLNYTVLLTCAVCLVTYAVMVVILRRLDRLDVRRVQVIPFCGKGGRFKYEILVKTGWGRGSGEGRAPIPAETALACGGRLPQGHHLDGWPGVGPGPPGAVWGTRPRALMAACGPPSLSPRRRTSCTKQVCRRCGRPPGWCVFQTARKQA